MTFSSSVSISVIFILLRNDRSRKFQAHWCGQKHCRCFLGGFSFLFFTFASSDVMLLLSLFGINFYCLIVTHLFSILNSLHILVAHFTIQFWLFCICSFSGLIICRCVLNHSEHCGFHIVFLYLTYKVNKSSWSTFFLFYVCGGLILYSFTLLFISSS